MFYVEGRDGIKGRNEIYGDYERKVIGVVFVCVCVFVGGGVCWILLVNLGIFIKANMNFNENREEIIFIRKKKKF